MRNAVALLSCLLFVYCAIFTSKVSAAKRQKLKPPLTEEQMLAWLIENNHDAERLPGNRYRIYWRDYDSEDHQTDEGGRNFTVRTFDWGPRGDIVDVVVSSQVERAQRGDNTSSSGALPAYRYHYRIESLPTSQQSVSFLHVYTPDLPRNRERHITNPPLWGNSGLPPQYEWGNNRVTWIHKVKDGTYGLPPGTSQAGFAFQCQSLPGIVMSSIDSTGGDPNGLEGVNRLHDSQTEPRGPVIGPVAIPVGTSVLELTRRLETLTSQCVELGWLDASAAAPLKQQLANSLTALGKNQQSAAKRALGAFVATLEELGSQVEASAETDTSPEARRAPEQEPVIIAEALTLLKTNAVYLLTRF